MDFVPYAVPFFIALIVVELLLDRWRGQRNYRVADAINSLSTGVLSTSTGLLTKGVGLRSEERRVGKGGRSGWSPYP